MNDAPRNDKKDDTFESFDGYFSGWNPLDNNWLGGLTGTIREIVESARQCLIDNSRLEQDVTDALMQIKDWQKDYSLIMEENIPAIIRKEHLGSRLNLDQFIKFLLSHKLPSDGLRKYEFVALVLLQEINGLAELAAVASKNDLSANVQYLTYRIVRLHIAFLLLHMADTMPQQHQQDIFGVTMYLFSDHDHPR